MIKAAAEAGQLGAGEASGVAGWPDASVEESFVSVDVAHSVKERLVQQRRLDGGLAVAEERDEVFESDGEGFGARTFVFRVGRDDGEASEASCIDETELFAAAEGQDGMGVRRDGRFRCGDEQAAGHAEVDKKLGLLLFSGQVDDDGFADAVYAVNAAASKRLDDLVGRRLEGLRLIAGPDGADGLAVDAGVDAVGYRFDFGELGHGLLQV